MLADNSFDSILLTDVKDDLITYTNAAFTTLTGWEASEVIGKSPKLLQGDATDKKVIARLTKALKDGGDFEGSAINYKKDGTPFIMCALLPALASVAAHCVRDSVARNEQTMLTVRLAVSQSALPLTVCTGMRTGTGG